jgi:6-phosphogluconate dehydrogenase
MNMRNGTAKIGMMGLGVMGQNLVLNMERNGFPVAVWEREAGWVNDFIRRHPDKNIIGTHSVQDFAQVLERPRKIMIMVKAGQPVDWTIQQIKQFLEPGDIVIDGGNSFFEDTRRREKELSQTGLRFMGVGVSGGESGALWGPSIMPGGERAAYQEIQNIFQTIAAKVDDGPCVTYIGPDGAGHFVKMVHNGIEYGDMQLIAEAYDLLRKLLKLKADEIADIFENWNQGVLNSFLIEITAKIFTVKDPESGKPLVDLIADKAGQKGTGRWTASIALELGIAIPTIHSAIEARVLSSLKEERIAASREISGPQSGFHQGDQEDLIRAVHDALYASKICSYAQGMALIQAGSKEYNWNIDLAELSRIWKGGCIIRAIFLDEIKKAYRRNSELTNLMIDPEFKRRLFETQTNWRKIVSLGQSAGIPLLAMSASLSYFDMYRTADLPQNLTQAQRDFFGSHLYERIDQPERGQIHTDWIGITGTDVSK